MRLAGRGGMDRQRMDPAGEFGGERRINQAMALQPALPGERLGHNIDAVMGLTFRPVSGMTCVQVRLVLDGEALRGESLGQLVGDDVGGAHAVA